jgi:hypothetical protein
MKIGLVLKELHRSENDLVHALLHVSERHKVDHEVFYLARDLAGWSTEHLRELAAIAKDYGQDLDPDPGDESGLGVKLREKGSELLGRDKDAGLLLLEDLREIYLKASGVSVDWEMLAQAAQGIQHTDLLEVTKRCRPETLRQAKWANAKLKESCTQILIS